MFNDLIADGTCGLIQELHEPNQYKFFKRCFYPCESRQQAFEEQIVRYFQNTNTQIGIINVGTHDDPSRPFKGNGGLADTSHYWVTVEIHQ